MTELLASLDREGTVRLWNGRPSRREEREPAEAIALGGEGTSAAALFEPGPVSAGAGSFHEVPLPDSTLGVGCRAAAWGDADCDGRLDLFLAYEGQSRLLRNFGGRFVDATPSILLESDDLLSGLWGDLDRDGQLDILILLSGSGSLRLLRNAGSLRFTDATPLLDDAPAAVPAMSWIDWDGDGRLDLYLLNYDGRGTILENRGESGFLPRAVHGGEGARACAWGDFDGDGDADLCVANAPGALLERSAGALEPRPLPHPLTSGYRPRGLVWADLDGHPRLDLAVSRGFARQRLLWNEGPRGFTVSDLRCLSSTGMAVAPADHDNDGDLDLLFVFGDVPPVLLRNDGQRRFLDVTAPPLAGLRGCDRAAWGDFDDDGDLDLLLALWWDRPRLFRNDSPKENGWLHLDLEGSRSNGPGIGARVVLEAAGRRQLREVSSGGGNFSQDSLTMEFGLGSASEADSIEVRWPSGTVDRLTGVPANRRICVREGAGLVGSR